MKARIPFPITVDFTWRQNLLAEALFYFMIFPIVKRTGAQSYTILCFQWRIFKWVGQIGISFLPHVTLYELNRWRRIAPPKKEATNEKGNTGSI